MKGDKQGGRMTGMTGDRRKGRKRARSKEEEMKGDEVEG